MLLDTNLDESEEENEEKESQDIDSATAPLISPENKTWVAVSPYDQPLPVQIFILFCVSFITFGSYFAYDAVSALEEPIKDALNIDAVEFGLLYSVYSFPNIVFVLIGGVITDRIGNRFSVLLFCSLFTAGSAIVAIACAIKSWYVMLAGRFIFGIGAESSYVVQNNICIEWFSRSKYFAFAMGVTLTLARLGSILAFTTVTVVADFMGSYHYGLWFGVILAAFSLFTSVLFSFVDKYLKHRVGFKEPEEKTAIFVDPRKFNRFYFMWLVVAVLIYSAIYPFLGTAGEYIADKWNISDDDANNWLGFIGIVALLLSPPFGFLVDWTGKKGLLVVIGISLAVTSFLLMGLTSLHPACPILLLGFHFALMPAALWPCMAFITEEKYSGFGFALASSLMNASLTAAYALSGYIVESYGFTWFCLFFACLSGGSLLIAILWNVLDRFRDKPVLNTKVKPREGNTLQ